MKTQTLKTIGAAICVLGLSAALQLRAQPFGGFGGFGGFNNNQNRSSSSSSQTFNSAGSVGNATITVDPDTHNLVINADEETTRSMMEAIKNLDHPQPQVLIKVVFLEVQHNNSFDFGIEGTYNGQSSMFGRLGNYLTNYAVITNFTATGSSSNFLVSGTTISPSSLTSQNNSYQVGQSFGLNSMQNPAGTYSILGSDFQATLRAIAQNGKAQLLSRPSVLARNNQPATIVVGQQVPLITNVRYDTFGNAVNSVTYQNVGIILKVTPFITGDGMVQMIVQPQTSSLDPTTSVPISAGVNAPVIDIRSADTVVLTPDGQTVVIGGLMRNDSAENISKVPFLGDIPLLGNLFRHKSTSSAKTELMIFLTPYVVQAPTQLAALAQKEKARTLVPKSYSEQELDRFLDKVPEKKPTDVDKKSKKKSDTPTE